MMTDARITDSPHADGGEHGMRTILIAKKASTSTDRMFACRILLVTSMSLESPARKRGWTGILSMRALGIRLSYKGRMVNA